MTTPVDTLPLADLDRVELSIGGMTCAACAGRVERALGKLDGVTASVNFATERAVVTGLAPSDADQAVAAVKKAGYEASVRVDGDDDVLGEVQDALKVPGGEVKKQAEAAGDPLGEPDVGHGSGQVDVAQPLTTHLALDHLHATLLADDALVFHSFVFTACALPVLHRPKYLGAEKTVSFRLEGPVIDSLGFFNLSVRPGTDFFRGRDPHADGVKHDRVFWFIEI